MSILTKVLMGLVVVAVFPLIYYPAAGLKVQAAWRANVDDFVAAVAKEERQNYDKLHGDEKARVERFIPGRPIAGVLGVRQLEVARDNAKLGRGRFWYATRIGEAVDPTAGTFKIEIRDEKIDDPNRSPLSEHGIKDRSFVYLFQMNHDGTPSGDDRYVGEFVVSGITVDADGKPTDALVTLRPAMPYVAAQWDALKSGSGNWVVYEHMPIDDHDVFSNLSEDDIRARLPASVVNEYLYDDKPPSDAVLADPRLKQYVIEDKETGAVKFLRPLRDYQQIFRNVALRAAAINDRLIILRKEKEYADRAKVQAEAMIAGLKAREEKLAEEKARLERELSVAQSHREKLEAVLADVQQQLQARLIENKRLADELAGRGRTAAVVVPWNATARTP